MPVVTPITIRPFPSSRGSLRAAARVWQDTAGQVARESEDAARAAFTARRGGTEIRSEAAGVAQNRNQTMTGVAASRPIAESRLAWRAQGATGGASRKIGDAEANSRDPTATVPEFDRNRPFAELDPAEAEARRKRDALARQQRAADDTEERLGREAFPGEGS